MANAQEIALIDVAQRRGLLTPADLARLEVARRQLPGASLPELLAHQQLPTSPVGALHRDLTAAQFVCGCGYTIDYPGLVGLERFTCPRCSGRLDPIQDAPPLYNSAVSGTVTPKANRSLVGRMIGPYRIEGELGRGNMGVVFEAVRPELSRRFALKVLLDGTDEEAVRRFKREATVASRLEDPGVVGVYDVGVDDGRHYYAMDYVEGRSLRERLREGPLRPRQAAALVRELARVMQLAHAQEVTHRDLKPANVLLVADERGEERPRIADFGLARDHRDLMSSLSRTGDVFGTPLYMSPEQILGLRVDAKADIYALGVILYECLVNQTPFYDSDWITLAQLIRAGKYPPPSQIDASIPTPLDAIVARAMALEPEDRYSSAGELEADLAAFLERSRDDLPAPELTGRSPLVLAFGAVALVLALVLVGLLIARRPAEPAQADAAAAPTPDLAAVPPAPQPNPRVSRALADAEAALEANDTDALRRAIRTATAADAPGSPQVMAARRRLAQVTLARARAAEVRPTPAEELRHARLAVWLLGEDPQGETVAERLQARALVLRRRLARFEHVAPFLETALTVPTLSLPRREAIQLDRVRLAYARGRFDDVIRLLREFEGRTSLAAREAQLVVLLARASKAPSVWPDILPALQQLASGSDLVATCATNILLSTRRDRSALSRQAEVTSALQRTSPPSSVLAISTSHVLGPLRHPEELSLIRAAADAIPDDWDIQVALGRAQWRAAAKGDQRRPAARMAFARAVELTAPDGPFARNDWLKYAILLALDRKHARLLAIYQRDDRRLYDLPNTDYRAQYYTLLSIATFMSGDTKRASAILERALPFGLKKCRGMVYAMPDDLRDRFRAEVGRPLMFKLGMKLLGGGKSPR